MSEIENQLPADIDTLHALMVAACAERDAAIAERETAIGERDRALSKTLCPTSATLCGLDRQMVLHLR